MFRRYVWLIPLLWLMTGVGATYLANDTFWLDETLSLKDAGYVNPNGFQYEQPQGIGFIIRNTPMSHPYGFYLLLAGWLRLTGVSEFSGRALSLLIGVLSVAMIYRAAADMISRRAGLVAACLLSTSAFYFHYLHEMRMYTALVLLVIVCLWAYWHLVQGDERLPTQVIAVFSLTALLYTHYLGLLLIAGIGLYHLLLARKDGRWLQITALALLSGLLYLPGVPNLLLEINRASSDSRLIDVGVLPPLRILADSAAVFSNSYLNPPVMFAFSFFPLFVLTVGLAVVRWGRSTRYLLFVALVITVALVWLGERTGLFVNIRYVLVLLPVIVLLLAAGLHTQHPAIVGVLLAIWVASGWWNYTAYEIRYNRDPGWALPWHTITAALVNEVQRDDAVIVHAPAHQTAWQHQVSANYYTGVLPAALHMLPLTNAQAETRYRATVFERIYARERVFSVYSPQYPPDTLALFEAAVMRDYLRCPAPLADTPQVHIDVFALTVEDCSIQTFVD